MTKLSHIPMQIQKWIASLTHLFFLILGLTGICLMYIHGNFGLGLTGIGSVPYEDTAEFNTQFNSRSERYLPIYGLSGRLRRRRSN